MKSCLPVILLVCLPLAVATQEPLSSERPSFSSSPIAMTEGRLQLEGGYQFTRLDSGADAHTLGQFLLRWGAGEKVEVQVAWSGFLQIDAGPFDADGFGDAAAGIKWQLSDDDATTPIGLFAGLSLPIGDDEFSSDEVDPAVGLFWAHNGRVSLFGTVLVSDSGGDTLLGNAVGINLPAPGACGRCGAYIEYVGQHPEGSGPQHSLNGGLTILQHNDLQFDINASIGLNDRAPDGSLGVGVAYRF